MGSSSSSSRTPRRTPSLLWTVRVKLAALAVGDRLLHSCIRRPVAFFEDQFMKTGATPNSDASEVRSADITVDASHGLWVRVFCPSAMITDDAPLPVFVYLHGGGFVHFSPSSRPYDAFCRRLCREIRAVIVSLNYCHAPQHRFPIAYDDGVAALRYLDETTALPLPTDIVPVPTIDLSSCFLVGDSSGGNMVHHVAQRWASMSATLPPMRLRLVGAILIQPFFGGEERTEAEVTFDKACRILSMARADDFWRDFLPKGATRDHPAARVCGEGVELADTFPPVMLVSGGFDLLRDWHAKYVETLRAKGKMVRVVDYPDVIHGFYVFPELPDSGKLVNDMKLFVNDYRSKPLV